MEIVEKRTDGQNDDDVSTHALGDKIEFNNINKK